MMENKRGLIPSLNAVSITNAERTPETIKELIAKVHAGELLFLDFPCVTFVDGPNANGYRFYSDDLEQLASSFMDVPFLYDHDTSHIVSRHGKVTESALTSSSFEQKIRLSTPASILHYLRGNIDRFSIGWYYDDIDCSICKTSWFGCHHWPNRVYSSNGEDVRCEIYFVNPRGKEVSAVNVPAVQGTGLLGVNAMENNNNDQQRNATAELQPVAPERLTPTPTLQDAPPNEWLATLLDVLPEDIASSATVIINSNDNPTPAFVRTVVQTLNSNRPTPAPVATVQRLPQDIHVPQQITGHPVLSNAVAPVDKFVDAWVLHFGGSPENPVPRYARDIRQLYQDMTGDVNWRGIVDQQYALAAADTVSLPNVVVDALNRVFVPLWDAMHIYKWYYPIVKVVPNDGTLQDMKWVTLGGISNLPVVAEGAAYTEAAISDSKEEDPFKKYGAWVGITMEMIRKSLVAQLQEVPRLMALSAHRTRSALVAGIFTDNSGVGPTLDQDSKALFHTDHSNLATTAFSSSAWAGVRTSMFNQAELGSGKPIAVWPRYCLLPVDLYDTAREVFGYGSGSEGKRQTSSGRAVNPYGQDMDGDPRPLPIVVPDFTDTNNWAAIADPLLHPVIHMSYGQQQGGGSHPKPEIFSATNTLTGLNFTNDVLAVKIRDLVSVGVSTYRGIAKRNVA